MGEEYLYSMMLVDGIEVLVEWVEGMIPWILLGSEG